MKSIWRFALLGLTMVALGESPAAAGISQTKHNLSWRGRGNVKSDDEKEICIFCHTPHNAASDTPLWNRDIAFQSYTPYRSSTQKAEVGQPTYSTKLCLSCHDGTVALGRVRNRSREIPMAGHFSEANLMTTDLSDDHPVSFDYDSRLFGNHADLKGPSELTGPVRLDSHGQMQCISCHDPHSDTYPKFLIMSNDRSALCLVCHEPLGWSQSAHAESEAGLGASGIGSEDAGGHTVASAGCAGCHAIHGAGGPQRLLRLGLEEENCLDCHNGRVAATDIRSEITKPFSHSVQRYNHQHDPLENPDTMPFHVECEDCHDPHASGEKLEIAAAGKADRCLDCHGDERSAQSKVLTVPRVISEIPLREKFNPRSPSFHPVGTPGRNPNVPSLLPPLDERSMITCIDCHNSDSGPAAGGGGPAGPHGSRFPHLLERSYNVEGGRPESYTGYALCYKCHDRASLLSDASFPHRAHLEKGRASCSACHDPHGVSSTVGNSTNNAHLINFDANQVVPNRSAGRLAYESLGTFSGQCYLSCHGVEHGPMRYPQLESLRR